MSEFDMKVYMWFAIIVVTYFLPTIAAFLFMNKSWKAILYTNIMIGWTVLGWFALFVWAFDREGE